MQPLTVAPAADPADYAFRPFKSKMPVATFGYSPERTTLLALQSFAKKHGVAFGAAAATPYRRRKYGDMGIFQAAAAAAPSSSSSSAIPTAAAELGEEANNLTALTKLVVKKYLLHQVTMI